MSFFRSVKKRAESVVLIDIGAESVAGAYAHYADGALPTLLYTRRFPVEAREHESAESAMLRALQVLGDTLIREGAPVLARATGSGSASGILVSIDAPWQKTFIQNKQFEKETPFVFTRDLVADELEKNDAVAAGSILVDRSIIGITLNGYKTNDPYGKKAHRATVTVLTSSIDEQVARGVRPILQSLYHTKHILPIAGGSLRYQAVRKVFPHERDTLIIDAMNAPASIALIRNGLLLAVADIPKRVNKEGIVAGLTELVKAYPLPHTIFLLAREKEADPIQQTLAKAGNGTFWLSDNPPKVLLLLPSHVAGLVRQTTSAPPDLILLLMALYYQKREVEGH